MAEAAADFLAGQTFIDKLALVLVRPRGKRHLSCRCRAVRCIYVQCPVIDLTLELEAMP